MTTVTVRYVAQYVPWGAGDRGYWADLAKKDTPEEARDRITANEAGWDLARDQAGRPSRYRIIRRQIVEDVMTEIEHLPGNPVLRRARLYL